VSEPQPPRRTWWPRIVILGIVAALAWWVATPRYADYPERSKVQEALAVAGMCKTSLAEFIQARRAFASNAREAGCSEEPTRYTAGTRVSGGRVEVTIRTGHPYVDGMVLSLEATRDAAGTTRAGPSDVIEGWRCGNDAAKEAQKYLPANCRQPPLPP